MTPSPAAHLLLPGLAVVGCATVLAQWTSGPTPGPWAAAWCVGGIIAGFSLSGSV